MYIDEYLIVIYITSAKIKIKNQKLVSIMFKGFYPGLKRQRRVYKKRRLNEKNGDKLLSVNYINYYSITKSMWEAPKLLSIFQVIDFHLIIVYPQRKSKSNL
ncbi:hypothetical protein NQ315_005078 [Exocentrus adspersus]|uniref:Uncharacterized protein n=1 Tax=Exocentrus adspersus TaxID=1586481 RepID=A0AAV8VQI4_9CUCU|nr:hypothetical protein NQ315_005078 [Exocentrus adspersus]